MNAVATQRQGRTPSSERSEMPPARLLVNQAVGRNQAVGLT
jgi:hypothetical protein